MLDLLRWGVSDVSLSTVAVPAAMLRDLQCLQYSAVILLMLARCCVWNYE